MEKLNIDQLKPESAIIKVKDKEYELRPVNLSDWSWLQKRFGKDLNQILTQMPMHELVQIAFRLLKDKSEFVPKEVEDHDDDGAPIKRMKNGPEQFSELFEGVHGIQDLAKAFLKCVGVKEDAEQSVENSEVEPENKKKLNP